MLANMVVVNTSEVGDNDITLHQSLMVERRIWSRGIALNPAKPFGTGEKLRRDIAIGTVGVFDVAESILGVGDSFDFGAGDSGSDPLRPVRMVTGWQ